MFRLKYTVNQLLEIKQAVDHQRRFRVLEPKACVNIRKFRINRKKTRRGKRHKNQVIPRSVEFSNLILVKLNTETRIKRPQRNIRITTLNAQSVKNKDQLIADYILNTKVNYTVITETWLRDTDDIWTEGSDLNQNGLKIWKRNRTSGIGGGLALITHQHTRVKEVTSHTYDSFEHGIWIVKHPGITLTICSIYRPPPSAHNKLTINQFLDEFTEFTVEVITQHTNPIFIGDFNVHANDLNNPDTEIFIDTMSALGLDQHVDFPTHKGGNTLDLLFTKCIGRVEISKCSPGEYISDHLAVEANILVDKEDIFQKDITIRKLKNMDRTKFIEDLNLDELPETDNINTLVNTLEQKMKESLNCNTPETSQRITVRPKNPWLSDDLREQKRLVRQIEKKWRKYRLEAQWYTLKKERDKYKCILREIKMEKITAKVLECDRNLKKLYDLVSNLTGTKVVNPLPEHNDSEQLANEFADFFMEKIRKIRNSLDTYPIFNPHGPVKASFDSFKPVSIDDIVRLVRSMPTKSCESDAIPTSLLKEILPELAPTLA